MARDKVPVQEVDQHLGFARGLAYCLAQTRPEGHDDQLTLTIPMDEAWFNPGVFALAMEELNEEEHLWYYKIGREVDRDGKWFILQFAQTEGDTAFVPDQGEGWL